MSVLMMDLLKPWANSVIHEIHCTALKNESLFSLFLIKVRLNDHIVGQLLNKLMPGELTRSHFNKADTIMQMGTHLIPATSIVT